MQVGVLALQGAVTQHEAILSRFGLVGVPVRRSQDLSGLSGIIIPGGESTTMLKLLKSNELWDPLAEFIGTRPTWGICAGAILLAKKVTRPVQPSFEAIDIEVERNAYGRQVDSFVSALEPTEMWPEKGSVEGVFIRAPKIATLGRSVRVLLKCRGEPVIVEEENVMVSTFHPELSDSSSVHRYFLKKMVH